MNKKLTKKQIEEIALLHNIKVEGYVGSTIYFKDIESGISASDNPNISDIDFANSFFAVWQNEFIHHKIHKTTPAPKRKEVLQFDGKNGMVVIDSAIQFGGSNPEIFRKPGV